MIALPPPTDDDDIPVDDIISAERAARKSEGRTLATMSAAEVSREVIDALHRHIDPDKIGRVLNKMLDATRTLKSGAELPDTRAQEAAAKLYLAYVIGTPIQRTENLNISADADTAVGMEERLRRSPALRDLFRRMLDKVDEVQLVD